MAIGAIWGEIWGPVWNPAIWSQDAVEPEPEPEPNPQKETFAGGFILAFELEMARRRREAQKREEDEEEAQRLQDAIDREIAELMHKQEAERAKAQEIERLRRLVVRYDNSGTSSERVEKAYARALAQQNMSAFLALNREIERMLEEEELLVLTMLLN